MILAVTVYGVNTSLVEINRYQDYIFPEIRIAVESLKIFETILQDLVEPLVDGRSLNPNSSGTPSETQIKIKVLKNLKYLKYLKFIDLI